MADLRSGARPREPREIRDATARPLPARLSSSRPSPAGGPMLDPGTARRTPVVKKPRPDPGPLRIAIGLTGMVTASALISAFLTPSAGGTAATVTTMTVAAPPTQPVQHITRFVQLAPGQTAPPQAVVQQAPAPKPRVVIVTTKQSGG